MFFDRRWLLAVFVLSLIILFVIVSLCEGNIVYEGPILGPVCRPLMHKIIFPVSDAVVRKQRTQYGSVLLLVSFTQVNPLQDPTRCIEEGCNWKHLRSCWQCC